MDAFTSDSRQIYLNRATHISLNGERAVNPRLLKSDQDGIERAHGTLFYRRPHNLLKSDQDGIESRQLENLHTVKFVTLKSDQDGIESIVRIRRACIWQ